MSKGLCNHCGGLGEMEAHSVDRLGVEESRLEDCPYCASGLVYEDDEKFETLARASMRPTPAGIIIRERRHLEVERRKKFALSSAITIIERAFRKTGARK